MKLSFSRALVVTILIVIAAAVGWTYFSQSPLDRALGSWGVRMSLPSFNLTSQTTEGKTASLEAKNGATVVDVNRNLPIDATKFISDRQVVLASLYEPTSSPYPEVITNVLNCPTELKPKVASSSAGVLYLLPAGERQNYGVCTADLVRYHSSYGIFNCGAKGVFEVRVFTDSDERALSLANSFSCSR